VRGQTPVFVGGDGTAELLEAAGAAAVYL